MLRAMKQQSSAAAGIKQRSNNYRCCVSRGCTTSISGSSASSRNNNMLKKALTVTTSACCMFSTQPTIFGIRNGGFSSKSIVSAFTILDPTSLPTAKNHRSFVPMTQSTTAMSRVPNMGTSQSSQLLLSTKYYSQMYKYQQTQPHQTQSRLYSSRRPNNDKEENSDDSVIGKALTVAKNVAKNFVPSSWFHSEEERKQALERQRVKDEISGSVNEMLRDAPFPIRMIGRAMAPLLSSVASSVAEAMEEQQSAMEQVLRQAEICIQNDPTVIRTFGTSSIQIGSPISQSTSTTSIDGKINTEIELTLPVTASSSGTNVVSVTGICRIQSSNEMIKYMEIQMNDGRRFPVDTVLSTSSSSSTTSTRIGGKQRSSSTSLSDNDNIIEAEIIEKTKK